jgi:DNA polymerase III alpha subunit
MEKSKVKKVRYIGKIPVMDITVDSDEHLFFANGIATSNCAAHAKAYSVYSAVQLWLQDHYFLEYMCALLSHIDRAKEKKGVGMLNERVEYCIKHGTYIYYPNVNESGDKWKIKAGGLLAPLKNIKGFSDKDVNIIESHRPYLDLIDFLNKTEFNNKKFETLLFANAFNEWGTVEDLYNWYYNHYFEKDKKTKKKVESKTDDLFAQMGFDDGFTIEEESSSEIENIKTFTKSELEEKCMDLNGFVIPDNIMMKYYYVYSSHLSDIVKNTEDTRDGRSKIYKLSDLSTMKKTDTSEPVWVLAQVKNIAVNLKTKTGKTFSKVIINDGETSLTLFIWQDHLPSFFNKGNVIILPLRVVTDEDTEENKITFASWKADKVDIPILEYGE